MQWCTHQQYFKMDWWIYCQRLLYHYIQDISFSISMLVCARFSQQVNRMYGPEDKTVQNTFEALHWHNLHKQGLHIIIKDNCRDPGPMTSSLNKDIPAGGKQVRQKVLVVLMSTERSLYSY